MATTLPASPVSTTTGPAWAGGDGPSYADARGGSASEANDAAESAADSLPAFWSVTQSSNRNEATGVSSDRGEAAFSLDSQGQPQLTVTVTRADGSTLALDTARHLEGTFEAGPNPYTGRTWSRGNLFDSSSTGFTLASVAVDWSATDSTNYLGRRVLAARHR